MNRYIGSLFFGLTCVLVLAAPCMAEETALTDKELKAAHRVVDREVSRFLDLQKKLLSAEKQSSNTARQNAIPEVGEPVVRRKHSQTFHQGEGPNAAQPDMTAAVH